MATSAEEHAVSTLWQAPFSPRVNDSRPAAIEELRQVAANALFEAMLVSWKESTFINPRYTPRLLCIRAARRRWAPRKRRVSHLEQKPLLRVHRSGLRARDSEATTVEALHAAQEATMPHAVALRPAQVADTAGRIPALAEGPLVTASPLASIIPRSSSATLPGHRAVQLETAISAAVASSSTWCRAFCPLLFLFASERGGRPAESHRRLC